MMNCTLYTEEQIFQQKPKSTATLMGVYPKVSGLATWSKNCKWYSSLPLGAVVSLFSESV